MNSFDYAVVAGYLVAMLGLGYRLRDQRSETDYFLAGNRLGWFPLALSVMATQLSAISFISAPAFAGLRQGGGLTWLTYEFGVPLAMVAIMFLIAPALYRSKVISIYDFLERRVGRSTRLLISATFQTTRSFATGIMVYAMGLILNAVMDIPFWMSVILISVITITYSLQGGMRAVVYTDATQMLLIVIGLVVCGSYALQAIGGIDAFLAGVETPRLEAIDLASAGFAGDEFGFWPMLLGGLVLYMSYYGCDQSQAQRTLSARSLTDVRKLLLANGLLRFPVTLLYCLVGLVIGALVASQPAVMARIPPSQPDYMMPIFILEYLPHGFIGLLIVAILAAAMSSLSGTINSLAAVTGDDLARLGFAPRDARSGVIRSRTLAFAWGAVILACSAFGGKIAPTVIEAINKIGSSMYGPVLGVFVVAVLRPGTKPIVVNAGLIGGVATNVYCWLFVPHLFWMWWNVLGLLVTLTIVFVLLVLRAARRSVAEPGSEPDEAVRSDWLTYGGALFIYFVIIIAVSHGLSALG